MENVNKQLLDAVKEFFSAEQSEGREKTGHVYKPATREHQQREWMARIKLHEAIAAAEQAQQAEPVALSVPFFAYDEEVGFERFATEAEAKKFVQEGIDECRSNMLQGEAWPSEIENLCWGVVLGGTKEIKLGDADDGSGDYYSDYVLTDAAQPPAVAVPGEMTHAMMRAVQLRSELGAYAAANLSGAYDLFADFWRVALEEAQKGGQ